MLRRVRTDAVAYIISVSYAIVALIPFAWMVSTAFKERTKTFLFPPEWIPQPFVLDNIIRVWNLAPFGQYLINTAIVTAFVLIFQLLFSSMAGYGFARLEFPGRDGLFLMFLGSMMIPPIVTMIPQYLIMRSFGWVNTYQGIILPSIFVRSAFGVFFMRQFFLTIPKDLEQAASIDGAGVFRTFWSIILPLAQPAIATLGVLTFVSSWNNFLWPLVITTNPARYMISIGLANLQGPYTSDWSGIMAGAFITVLPILLVFVVAQKYFVQSIHMSGLK
jgi:ABC-type glycerol-3-phosphate transport system permease component